MKTILEEMVDIYNLKNIYEQKNAIKEVMQEIILYSLSQTNFFKEVAFYGGTALRIFYGLDRFSEDLDFSLKYTNLDFRLDSYLPTIKSIVQSFGLIVDFEMKEKTKESHIKSAFMKGDTIEQFLLFYPNAPIHGIHSNERIKIKFEIDISPPKNATFETKYSLLPSPYEILLYDKQSLFAGKLHAILCRSCLNRVKGRDLYDFVFFLSRDVPFNIAHLRERLLQSDAISKDHPCSILDIKNMLIDKFSSIDFSEAKKDIEPFIKNTHVLDIWSKKFFIQLTDTLTADEM